MFYEVLVTISTETDSGRVKKIKEYYLVEAVSCTDAEAKTYKYFEGDSFPNDFEVKAVKESKILKVINDEQ